MADVSRTRKEALFETISGILSPSQEIRLCAEEQIKALEVTDEFGVHLTELTLDPNGHLPIRQLASVLLKQYVEAHWSSQSEKFVAPQTTDEAKAAIRHMLPIGLKESISKVRTSVAYAISAIAHWDWPECWPELFDLMMQCLQSGDPNAVHGAMRVLTEFSREVTDNQMGLVAPVILPEMYKIFAETEKYSIRTRGRAVEIFTTCANVIAVMGEYKKGVTKTLLYPILPQFTEALVQALMVPDGMTSDSGLRKEVLNALTVLVKYVPKQMATWLPHILTPVWNTLTDSANLYVRTVVNDTDSVDNPVDSDGEVLGFENLVFSIFEFVSTLIETSKFRGMVQKGMTDLLYYIILYMQITEEQITLWANNPDQFVEDEDDDTYSYSIRISAQDLLLSLCEEFEDECASGLCQAVTKHLQEAEQKKIAGDPNWWRVHESCLLAMGSVKDMIVEQITNSKLQFDLSGFLETVVLADLSLGGLEFLVGRCLWTGSRYCVAMSEDLVRRFLQVTVSGLQANQPSTVRVSSVRAVWGFCEYLKSANQVNVIMPFLTPITEGLVTLSIQFSNEVLSLVMEAISIVLSIDPEFTASIESRVTPLVIAAFLKHNSDPVLVDLTQDIFKVLSQNPACIGSILQRLLPTLVSILQAPPEKIPSGLQGVAMDMLQVLVRNSPKPLAEQLITQAFAVAAQCTLQTEDNTTMQNGGEVMRAYISCAFEQIAAWQDDHGRNGLQYIIQVAQHLLDPRSPETASTFVGRLISVTMSKAGALMGEHSELLLRAVLSRLQQTETLSVIQSLVLVFAHLIHHQMDAVLDFLSSVPGPTGKSALHFVLGEWCSKQHLFFGNYDRKVNILALCKLLEHGIKTNDSRIQEVMVKGDQIIDPVQGIKTRSKTQKSPFQFTEIPVLVKIYKVLILELANGLEAVGPGSEASTDDGEDWGDTESDSANQNILSAFAAADEFAGYDDLADEEGAEDDQDALADPIYQINLENYLTQFLHLLAQQPCYPSFSQHHTAEEITTLKTTGIITA